MGNSTSSNPIRDFDELERTGYIYHQPCGRENGYVGQSRQEYGKREQQHRYSGKDTDMSYQVESDVPVKDLDAREAYHIGRLDTYGEGGLNLTRGNSRMDYDTGSRQSLRYKSEELDRAGAELDKVGRSLDDVGEEHDWRAERYGQGVRG